MFETFMIGGSLRGIIDENTFLPSASKIEIAEPTSMFFGKVILSYTGFELDYVLGSDS